MSEVASLVIRVQSDQVSLAGSRLRGLAADAHKAETATDAVMKVWRNFRNIIGGFIALDRASAAFKAFLNTAKEFETLQAQLKTVTGSTENAKQAFEALFDFALKTPYTMKEVTQAFIQMTSYGLEPSERALRSFGDTAASMGQEINDMVRAVARAISGEYEPLRTFGVQARKDGDEILLTFRGVTERMKNSAEAIQGYFVRLGEANFKGAMLERMETLEGKISNMSDAWDRLFNTISNAGVGEKIKEAIDYATNAINSFASAIDSGEFQMKVEAYAGKWTAWGTAVQDACSTAAGALDSLFSDSEQKATGFWAEMWNEVSNFLSRFPENVAMLMQGIGAVVGGAYDLLTGTIDNWLAYIRASFTHTKDLVVATFDFIKTVAVSNWSLDGWDKVTDAQRRFSQALQGGIQDSVTFKNAQVELYDKIKGSVAETISAYLDERDATRKTFSDKIAAANGLREAYDKTAEARKKAFEGKDRLAQFGKGGGGAPATAGFNELVMAIQTEAQKMQDIYEKRRELIISNTRGSSELLAEEEARYKKNLDIIGSYLDADLQRFEIYYQARKNQILLANKDNAEARDIALATLESSYAKEKDAVRLQGEQKLQILKNQHEAERLAIIENSKNNDALREKLLKDNEAKFADKRKKYLDNIVMFQPAATGNAEEDSWNLEKANLQRHHEEKLKELDEFRKANVNNEAEYLARLAELNRQYAEAGDKLEKEKFQRRLGYAADFFGNLSTVASAFGKKGAKTAKALAIVEATINTYKSATSAYSAMAGIPYVGPALGAVAAAAAIAAGMKQVQAIKAQEYSGAYAQGGLIPAGKYGLVGETGQPELVRGPAMVTSASRTAELLGGQGGGTNVQVNVINQAGAQVVATERETSDGRVIDVLIKQIETNVARSIRSGGTAISRAIENTYGVNRANYA